MLCSIELNYRYYDFPNPRNDFQNRTLGTLQTGQAMRTKLPIHVILRLNYT